MRRVRLAAAVIGAAGSVRHRFRLCCDPEQLYEWPRRPPAAGGAPTAVQRLRDVVALHAGNNGHGAARQRDRVGVGADRVGKSLDDRGAGTGAQKHVPEPGRRQPRLRRTRAARR